MKTVILVVLLTVVTLAGCTTPPVRPELSGNIANEFSQRKAPDSGGRLYVTMGIYKMLLTTISKGFGPGELFINNARVETVGNYPEFVVVDLQPGQYSVSWSPSDEFARTRTRANPIVVAVQDGEAQFLALDISETSGGALFGLIGVMAGVITNETNVRKEITGLMLEGRKPVSYTDLRKQKR